MTQRGYLGSTADGSIDDHDEGPENAYELALLAWAYSKLQHINFSKQEDALQLDRIKLLLEHGIAA